jgi:hypothetical protein
MVSLSERDAIVSSLKGDIESDLLYSFIFEKALDFDRVPDVPRTALLKAISNRSQPAFRLALEEIERRRVSEEHDWWSDDSLIFLLVLGCRLFDIESERLGEILNIREKNSNPVPRKLNQVYRALSRGEYAMEGEYCFIKVTFLRLLGRLDLSSDDAVKAYDALVRPNLLKELTPFNQLLSLRAYDLILHARTPTRFENAPQLVEGFEALSKHLSLGHAWSIFAALPIKAHVLWITTVIVVISAVCGFAYKIAEHTLEAEWGRKRPNSIAVKDVKEVTTGSLDLLRTLADALSRRTTIDQGSKVIVFALETAEIGKSSPTFSIEVSHPNYAIIDGFAFLKDERAGQNLTAIPAWKNNGVLRVLAPRCSGSSQFLLLLCIRCPQNQSMSAVAGDVQLRVLE